VDTKDLIAIIGVEANGSISDFYSNHTKRLPRPNTRPYFDRATDLLNTSSQPSPSGPHTLIFRGLRDGAPQPFTMSGGSNMFLYSLSILQPSSITQAILGAFSGKKQQEIVVAQGSRLSLLRPDATQGKVHEVLTHDVFGIIRCLAAFRLAGSSKGMLLLIAPTPRLVVPRQFSDCCKWFKVSETRVRRML
jgi:hypothetical protein